MYGVWIKIDDTLPWIELKGTYPAKSEARKAAEEAIKGIEAKVVNIPEQRKIIKSLASMKTSP